MALKIRMSRGGAKKRPMYRIVVTDSRSPRDGRFLERVGTYQPLLDKDNPDRLTFDAERVKYWLDQGALPSDRVASFLGQAEIIPMPARTKGISKQKAREEEAAKVAAEAEAAASAAEAEAAAAPSEGDAAEAQAESEPAVEGGEDDAEKAGG